MDVWLAKCHRVAELIEPGVRSDMEAFEKKLLQRLGQFNNTINFHIDPGVKSGIKMMDGRWLSRFTLRVGQNELEVNEGSMHKPEVGIDKPVLEVNGHRFNIILVKHGKHAEYIWS